MTLRSFLSAHFRGALALGHSISPAITRGDKRRSSMFASPARTAARHRLKPISPVKDRFAIFTALAERTSPAPELSLREIVNTVNKKVGNFDGRSAPIR